MSAFRPGWLPSLLVVLLLPGLCALGVWQLQRADEKRSMLASFEDRRQAAPLSVDQLLDNPDPAYRRVALQGYFDAEHSLLLDNRVRDGRAGVELLQPFHDRASGQWLLVNRGWLPWPDRRESPRFTTPEGDLRLTAWAYVAPQGGLQLQPATIRDGWPRLAGKVDGAALWQELDRNGLAVEMRLEDGPASYRVGWPIVAMSPDKHLGYAVQWFALAAALVGLFIYFGLHNARESRHEPSHRHA